ncbi:MAG: hypothetical protein NVS9B4_23390 [Candidatus Acidiferrum sp.]
MCADHWRITPNFFEAAPDVSAMLERADAALLIGDPALRLSIAIEPVAVSLAEGGITCKKAQAGVDTGPPSDQALYVYDLVEEWRRFSGFPAVLALWAGRPAAVTPDVLADFAASRDYGVTRIGEISEAAARELALPAAALASYLTENVDYSLDGENQRGLEHYYQRAASVGLIAAASPIHWAVQSAVVGTSEKRARI